MQRLSGHVGGLVRGEEHDRGRDFLGRPARLAGIFATMISRCLSLSLSVIGVTMNPGATQLAVTPRLAYSCAIALIMPAMPALAAT